MKSIEIYKTSKNYKICTLYKLESGSYISSKPIFILPLNINSKELSDKIFESLNSSHNLSESEEDTYWLGNRLLKELKETSFNKLYKNSKSCKVKIDGEVLSIIPCRYAGENEGLNMFDNESISFLLNTENKLRLTEEIIKSLSIKK